MIEMNAPRVEEKNLSFCQVLNEDFKACRHLEIEGGWGYTPEDAIVMKPMLDMVPLEYLIVEKRIYEELIIYRRPEDKYSGITWKLIDQALIENDGKAYDHLRFDVFAFRDTDWEYLANDWNSHRCFVGDEEGLARHEEEREKRQVHYVADYWFDITKKFRSTEKN